MSGDIAKRVRRKRKASTPHNTAAIISQLIAAPPLTSFDVLPEPEDDVTDDMEERGDEHELTHPTMEKVDLRARIKESDHQIGQLANDDDFRQSTRTFSYPLPNKNRTKK